MMAFEVNHINNRGDDMMTTVVNLRQHRNWKAEGIVLIDRRTMFGNPFRIGIHGDRDEVIDRYRKWFYGCMEVDSVFRLKVLALKEEVLGCWCVPKKCHGQIIADYLNGLGAAK